MAVDTTTNYPGIIIRLRNANESGMFPGLVKEALSTIASKPVGQALLNDIVALQGRAKFGFTVCIMRPALLAIEDKHDDRGPQWNCGSVAKRASEADASNKKTGSPTAVTWNSNIVATPDGSRPAFIALAHELVHALYNLKGEAYADASMEEYCTVGLPPVSTVRAITENRIRAEHNVPLRTAYGGLQPPVMATATV